VSDKPFDKLNPLDQIIRRTAPTGMCDTHTEVTIEYIQGFELFNTRPYHNYETWSDGYRVTGRGVTVEREDLDAAVKSWALKVANKERGRS